MKRLFLLTALACITLSGFSQIKVADLVNIKLYGFVRNYACYDNRESYTSNSEQFYYMPMDWNKDIYGDDINEKSNMMLLSITTRLGLNISGPEFLGAQTSAKIEADFAGFGTSNTVFRIRQAYTKMAWEKHDVLVGQAWHPMMGDMMPDVFTLETGAPFTPFSRSPQLRYNYHIKDVTLTATALYQYQYTSPGPDGSKFDYARDAVVPEIYLQAMYKGKKFQAGAGVDILTLKPRSQAITDEGPVKVSESIVSVSPTLFASYKSGNFGIKGRLTYAENAGHLSMISGYGVSKIKANGEQEYSPLRSIAGWMNITYKQNLKKGHLTYCLFAGYTKNLGSHDELLAGPYIRGQKNAGYIWRIAPSVLYTHNAMQIGIEYNPTTVGYGTADNKYKVEDMHRVTNHRICAMLKYNF